mgnify:CR=1 FL=1
MFTVVIKRQPVIIMNGVSWSFLDFKILDYGEIPDFEMKFEKGFVWEKWKTSGICWIFLLSGEAGVSIEDEVVFVEAGEMFLLPALKGKLKAFTPLEFLYFISDRPTEYCLKTVSELGCLEGRGELLEILPLNQLLKGFVEMLTMYLEDGVDCRYLFEEKQEELFVLMKSCYSKEQLSYFFIPFLCTKREI